MGIIVMVYALSVFILSYVIATQQKKIRRLTFKNEFLKDQLESNKSIVKAMLQNRRTKDCLAIFERAQEIKDMNRKEVE